MRWHHQKLHLQHHKHTGKLLHHRHTSYRGIALLLIVAGACMAGISYMQRVAANELFSINFIVPVPVPQTPPMIATPTDGATIQAGGTMITGSCPLISPAPIIAIAVDGKTVGSAVCNTANDFSFSTTLLAGKHQIVATPRTTDDMPGPASTTVNITTQGVSSIPSGTVTGTLTADSLFTTVNDNKSVTWTGQLTGAQKSYTLLMEWGDGNYESLDVSAGAQSLTHRYAQLASYNITIGIRDSLGRYQYQQFAAPTSNTQALAALTASQNASYQTAPNTTTVVGLYGLFVTAVCLVAIIKLHASAFAYAPIPVGHHA